MTRQLAITGLALASTLAAGVASAEPVIAPGGKPGVALSWTTKGNETQLALRPGVVPTDVAEAIRKAVEGAKVKAVGAELIVTGVESSKLLGALEKVDIATS